MTFVMKFKKNDSFPAVSMPTVGQFKIITTEWSSTALPCSRIFSRIHARTFGVTTASASDVLLTNMLRLVSTKVRTASHARLWQSWWFSKSEHEISIVTKYHLDTQSIFEPKWLPFSHPSIEHWGFGFFLHPSPVLKLFHQLGPSLFPFFLSPQQTEPSQEITLQTTINHHNHNDCTNPRYKKNTKAKTTIITAT